MDLQLIQDAFKEVPFYYKRLHQEGEEGNSMDARGLLDYPTMEKSDIIAVSIDLVAPRYLSELYQGKFIETFTSGSTGECLKIYWSKKDYMKSMFSLWYWRKRFYGIMPEDRYCKFYTLSEVGYTEPKTILHKQGLLFSKSDLTEARLLQIYHEMIEFQPKWLLLQPSIAELLCSTIQNNNLPQITSIKYIELTGELFANSLRQKLYEKFQCQIANQYGANEVNSIAYECPNGNLHCMENNVHIEILDADSNVLPHGQLGNIYVTTCQNHVMPFIRYGIGDIGSLDKKTCDCGHRGEILHLASARKNDWIYISEKEKVTPDVFIRAVDAVNAVFDDCIFQFQIIQMDYGYFKVLLAVDEEVEDIQQCFIDNIGYEGLRDAIYEFVFLNKLFPGVNGKRKFFECRVNENDDWNRNIFIKR